MTSKKPTFSTSPPSHSFHGSNSSHSKDNGSGGRTYHIPNCATSYANEKSSMISVTFDEGRGMPRSLTIVIVIFLLFAIIPVFLMACKTPKYTAEIPKSVEGSTSNNWSKEQNNWVRGDNSMALNPKGNVNGVRSEHESRQRDKERRTHWNKLQPDEQCVRFGTREYTARLRNLPLFTDWTKICRNTEANVHGVSLKPSYCKNKWPLGGVEGRWVVDFNEEDCTPHWGNFIDKGCPAKGSKTRSFHSRLWNIKHQQDRRTMCETAPANLQSLKNATPKLCDDRGIWGIYGIWEVDDPTC